MAHAAGSVAILLLVVLAGAATEGARSPVPAVVRVGAPSASTAPGTGVHTASVVDCFMGCASQATDCATSCTNKPLGDVADCTVACVEANLSCIGGCGPALRPAPPTRV